MLIEGVRSLSFGPAKQHESNLFTCVNSRTIEHMVSLTSRRMISTALSKLRKIRDRAQVLALPQHGGLRHNVCYAKIVALQLANYQRLCLNGHFMRRSVLSHVLLTFFVTLHLPFAWIYHVPRNIAIIIGHYHTEVDKLVVWSRLSLFRNWIIMTLRFKWLRCNDSHFRMGALEWHQSQMVWHLRNKMVGLNP